MRSPTQATHDVPGVRPYGSERLIESRPAHRVIHDIEALRIGTLRDIILQASSLVVDRDGAVVLNNPGLLPGYCREDLSTKSTSDLHREVAHPACARMHQYVLP